VLAAVDGYALFGGVVLIVDCCLNAGGSDLVHVTALMKRSSALSTAST